MAIWEIVIVYILLWWVIIFTVLPWGVTRDEEAEKKGFANSAPINPYLKKKFIITSIITAIICLICYCLADYSVISFRELAQSHWES